MIFSLESILSDSSKSIVLYFIFHLLGLGYYFLITMLVTAILRTNIGGFHMRGYVTCFLFSSVYFSGMVILFLNPINDMILISLGITSLLIQFFIAPVSTPQRENSKKVIKKAFKIKGMIISSIVLLLHIIINNPYTSISMWVVIIQTLFISLYKGVKIYEKNYRTTNKNTL